MTFLCLAPAVVPLQYSSASPGWLEEQIELGLQIDVRLVFFLNTPVTIDVSARHTSRHFDLTCSREGAMSGIEVLLRLGKNMKQATLYSRFSVSLGAESSPAGVAFSSSSFVPSRRTMTRLSCSVIFFMCW